MMSHTHINAPRWVIPTRRGDFSDFDLLGVDHAALRLDAFLQHLQHALLRELRHDLQVLNWNIKLGPVIGYHALTGASGNKTETAKVRGPN